MTPRNEETFDDIVRTVPVPKRRRKKADASNTVDFKNAVADAVPGYSELAGVDAGAGGGDAA